MYTEQENTVEELTIPIEVYRFFERRNAFELLMPESPIHPELLSQSAFEIDAIGNIKGIYEKDENGVRATYETTRMHKKFKCVIEAPIHQWALWNEYFPNDFVIKVSETLGGIIPYELKIQKTLQYGSEKESFVVSEPTNRTFTTKILCKNKFVRITKINRDKKLRIDIDELHQPINYPYL